MDLGSSSKEFKDAFFDGTVTTDALTVGSTSISANGITEADQWRITTDLSGDQTPISTNWERVDSYGLGYFGTGMTESSGTFTFPSTGIWLVRFLSLIHISEPTRRS